MIHFTKGYSGKPYKTHPNPIILTAGLAGADDYVLKIGEKFAYIVEGNEILVKGGEVVTQGNHIRLLEEEKLVIKLCEVGMKRIDKLVLAYEDDTNGSIVRLRIIEGDEDSILPIEPGLYSEDLLNGGKFREIYLYRLDIDGPRITVTKMYTELSELNANKISDLTDDTATTPIAKADTLTGLTSTAEDLNQLSGKVLGDIITHDTSEFGKNTIIGNAEPESETEGEVGQFYLNNTNNNLYQCTSFDNETSTYTWIKIDKAAVCGFYPTTNTPAEVGQIIKSHIESSTNLSIYMCVSKDENGKTSWKRIQFVEFAYSPIGLVEVPTEQTSTQNIGQIVYATSDPGEIYISVNYNPPYKWRKLAFKDDLLQKLSGFTLLNQTLTFTLNSTTNKYECTISNENVTNDSLVDIYFKTEYVGIAETAVINVESQTGRILITADNNPSSTLVCSIKVV